MHAGLCSSYEGRIPGSCAIVACQWVSPPRPLQPFSPSKVPNKTLVTDPLLGFNWLWKSIVLFNEFAPQVPGTCPMWSECAGSCTLRRCDAGLHTVAAVQLVPVIVIFTDTTLPGLFTTNLQVGPPRLMLIVTQSDEVRSNNRQLYLSCNWREI